MDDVDHILPAAPGPRSDMSRLAAAVSRLSRPAFAVVDGGHWKDLKTGLTARGLAARSLFLGAGSDTEAAGPWIVSLDQREGAANALLAFVGDKPAAVFWSCQPGEEALWRHLRTIDQVRLAKVGNAGPPEDASGPGEPAGARTETVLFRHWDPRALSMVLPVLDELQYARVLGPAGEAVFYDPPALGGLGLRRMARLPSLPEAPRGTLSLDADQVAALDEDMQQRSCERTVRYLQEYAPHQASHLGHAALYPAVAKFQAGARAMGIHEEQTMGLWAYMRLTSRHDLNRETLVQRYLDDPAFGATPDRRMEALFDLRTRALTQAN